MAGVGYSYGYNQPYLYDLTNGPAPNASLWPRFPLQLSVYDPSALVEVNNGFTAQTIASNTIGGWTFTSVTSGAITNDATNPNGILLIDSGASTANQGVNWQLNMLPFKIATGKPVAFEVGGMFTGLTTLAFQAFFGLAASSTAVIASGAMATLNRVGFQGIVTTTGVLSAVARQGGTAATSTGVTVANSTYYRLGFYATTTAINFYVNGVTVSTATTQIPTVAMAPTIVVQSNGTVQPVFALDYIKVAGYRN